MNEKYLNHEFNRICDNFLKGSLREGSVLDDNV